MRWLLPAVSIATLTLGACHRNDDLSVSEAQQALAESSASSEAETLMSNGVDISTNFTIGKAVKDAAVELKDFIHSQLPCAAITLTAPATLKIEYGKLSGACVYHHHTFSGTHEVSVMKDGDDEVLVHHQWTDFSNGKVSVSGTADVTWNRTEKSRHVVHDVTWDVIKGPHAGRSGESKGDRTQTPLAGGIAEGIRIDGNRSWDGERGHWNLEINNVEVRWADPVPQAGSYVLDTPFGKMLTLEFERVDSDTIRVKIVGPKHSFDFTVNALGQAQQS